MTFPPSYRTATDTLPFSDGLARAARERTAANLFAEPALESSAKDLRTFAEWHRILPPTVEQTVIFHSLRVAGDTEATQEWVAGFLDDGERVMGDYAARLFAQLAHLDDPRLTRHVVDRAVAEWRESPCGPPPTLLVLADGTAVLSHDGDTWTFDPNPSPRSPLRWLADLWLGR